MFQSIPFNNWIRNYCEIIFNQLLKRNIFKIISNQLLNKKNLWINFQLINFNNSKMKQSNVCNSINIFIVFIIFFVLSYFIAIVTFIVYGNFNIDKIIHVYKSGETIFSKFVWKYFSSSIEWWNHLWWFLKDNFFENISFQYSHTYENWKSLVKNFVWFFTECLFENIFLQYSHVYDKFNISEITLKKIFV